MYCYLDNIKKENHVNKFSFKEFEYKQTNKQTNSVA
jgi:hypothetical protein